MEKKVELQTKEGRKIKVMPHMVKDLAKFGATETKRVLKDPPKELLEKKTVIPAKVPDLKLEPVTMNLPEMAGSNQVIENTNLPQMGSASEEPKKRKSPVRSKTK